MAPYTRKSYGRTFIREWRKHHGLTLEQLASRVEMTASALSLLERGQSAYTQPTLEALAAALNTTPASLLMRNPLNESVWSIEEKLEKASPSKRREIVAVVETMIRTGTDN